MRRLFCAIALIGVVSVAVLGCSSSAKSEQSTSTTKGKSYQITTAGGQVTASLDGHLPPGWPNGFPVPPDAKAAGSGSVQGESGVMVAVYTLSGSPQDAFNFYKTNSQLTVDSSSSVGGSSAFVGTVKFSGTYDGRVTIGAVGDTNSVVAVLNTGGSSNSSSTSTSAS